jgi:putative tryptophan/tyrosine transport system substrate-binding protein
MMAVPRRVVRPMIAKLFTAVVVLLLAAPLGSPVEAQPPGKIYRVGYLGVIPLPAPRWQRFVGVFREAGLIEGQHVVFERRFAEGQAERYPAFAAELAALRPDVVVTAGVPAARAARQAMPATAIVAIMADLVGNGFAATVARPGGNITGFSYMSPEVSAKRLELLREAAPRASRVGVLWNPGNVHEPKVMEAVETAARQMLLQLQPVEVRRVAEYEAAFETLRSQRADALIVFENVLNNTHRQRIADLALASRLPTIFELRIFVDTGGLMSYGPTPEEWLSVLASQAVKILRGAKPASIPVQQPTKFELTINLKTARALGLTLPPSLLLRAHHVIE